MLDTSRNYFTVDSIKRTLVGMAHSKLNRFHWHITDSQSFPYVSKSYPQLAKYGAYSSKEIYTGDDIKEIADFARVRGIQVSAHTNVYFQYGYFVFALPTVSAVSIQLTRSFFIWFKQFFFLLFHSCVCLGFAGN